MKYRLIEAEKAEHRISRLCTVLGVTRQGFYAWRRRGPSLRQLGDDELAKLIVTIYDGSLQTYGAPRVQLELADDHDVHVGPKRVARLMRGLGIQGVSRRGKQPRTTVADEKCESQTPSGDRSERHRRRTCRAVVDVDPAVDRLRRAFDAQPRQLNSAREILTSAHAASPEKGCSALVAANEYGCNGVRGRVVD
jgi:hypothetical protein